MFISYSFFRLIICQINKIEHGFDHLTLWINPLPNSWKQQNYPEEYIKMLNEKISIY